MKNTKHRQSIPAIRVAYPDGSTVVGSRVVPSVVPAEVREFADDAPVDMWLHDAAIYYPGEDIEGDPSNTEEWYFVRAARGVSVEAVGTPSNVIPLFPRT